MQRHGNNLEYASLESASKWKNLPPPPGFSKSLSTTSKSKAVTAAPSPEVYDKLKAGRAWELAISPAKSLPMQVFMLYMSGSGVQIFSMGIVFMLLLSPFKNVATINTAFSPFAPTASTDSKSLATLAGPKLIYIACNLLTLGVGLWKCRSMGLLPTGSADWLAFESRSYPPELAFY